MGTYLSKDSSNISNSSPANPANTASTLTKARPCSLASVNCYGCSANCDPQKCMVSANHVPRVSRSFCSERSDLTNEISIGLVRENRGGISASIARVLAGIHMMYRLTMKAHTCKSHSGNEFGVKAQRLHQRFEMDRDLTKYEILLTILGSLISLIGTEGKTILVSLVRLGRLLVLKDSDIREKGILPIVQSIGKSIGMPLTAAFIVSGVQAASLDANPQVLDLRFDQKKFRRLLKSKRLSWLVSTESIRRAADNADIVVMSQYPPITGETLARLFREGYRSLHDVHFAARVDIVLAAMLHSSRISTKHKPLATMMIAATLGSVVRANMNCDLDDIPFLCRYVCAGFSVSKDELPPCSKQDGSMLISKSPSIISFWGAAFKTAYALLATLKMIVKSDNTIDRQVATALRWYKNPMTERVPMKLLENLFDSVSGYYDSGSGELKMVVKGPVKMFFDTLQKAHVLFWIKEYVSPNATYIKGSLKVQIPYCWVQSWRLAAMAMERRGHMAMGFAQDQLLAPLTWPKATGNTFPVVRATDPGQWLLNLKTGKLERKEDQIYAAVSYAGSEIRFLQQHFKLLAQYLIDGRCKYIWLDKLCWKPGQELSSYYDMMDIYASANFTVVVDPYASLSGVADTVWAERSWTRAELAVSRQVKLWIGKPYGTGLLAAYKFGRRQVDTIPEAVDWFKNTVTLYTEDSVLAFGAITGAQNKGTVSSSVSTAMADMTISKVVLYPPSCRNELSWLPAIGGMIENLGEETLATVTMKHYGVQIKAREISLRITTLDKRHWLSGSHHVRNLRLAEVRLLAVATGNAGTICWMTTTGTRWSNYIGRVIGCVVLDDSEFMELKRITTRVV
ncbi:hypothetical protein K450DRAFT_196830 [Umbelopsis ramanniana AG]|uniref:Heterokaryon incompatibility domain-containing protein n=1 Tax=Umbelopsis ramanniana AG TaxID=1314678 RepID=A0AAD5HGS1_UMBRA|nr:uncharacterized protein K450DRAFT_196830 [Umbelopsis ramanniana AG]KAI8582449.1 hypothetical protein K450DRAFT_196830 [Umbelopsis ramanniana AG]